MSTYGRESRYLTPWPAIILAAAFVAAAARPCFPQVNSPRQGSGGIFLPANRTDSRGIERAKELIAGGEFSQAIRFLDQVLARNEDSFVAGSGVSLAREETAGPGQTGDTRPVRRGASPRRHGDEHRGDRENHDEVAAGELGQSSASGEHAGLKETARRMLRGLPPEGRRIYETTFGPVARRLLAEAIERGDFQQLRQITQRYFCTPAGHEAALMFAQHEADQGRHLTAALTYQQLLESSEACARFEPQLSALAAMSWLAADNPARAAAILERLEELGYRDIGLSGQDYPLRASLSPRGDPADSMTDWLLRTVGVPVSRDAAAELQWLTSRGNPARNGQMDGGLPHLRVRWQVRLLEHHNLAAVHEEMAGVLARQERPRLPAATPLAVGEYVITRSAHGLIAIDFKTGKRIWQAQPQREALLQDLMEGSQRQNSGESNVQPAQAFARMIWEDYLYNTISSDGQRVYVIRDLALPKTNPIRSIPFMPNSSDVESGADTNRLCAYDLPTQGKLVWEIDGVARSDELQGAFFLGAPVVVGRSLYCLAEIKSETAIYLIALDRQTGALEWRQQLVDLETGIAGDTSRRLQAVTPSCDGGMLICPTGAGVVVGVDLAKQALAWAYSYRTPARPTLRSQMLESKTVLAKQQWVHSAPVIASGRVLLTPPESSMLHCLDLVTGKLLWKQPRGESLFLAGVDDDRVLIVGNHNIAALHLADGKPAWPSGSLALPAGVTPVGSGFFSKGQYFLPLSDAEVISVDVAQGQIVARTSSRDGLQLGNLICYRGAVISQTGRFLDCFEQVDVLRANSEQRLAADPTDSEALRTLGEIAYNEGRLAQAIKLLSGAYKSEPDDLRTREVLRETLIAALDEDFARHHIWLPILAELQQGSTAEQLTLLRLQSQGLLELGQATDAFDVCLKAYELNFDESTTALRNAELSIGPDHKVGAPSWLAAQAAAIWATASQDERQQMAERLALPLAHAKHSADASLQQQFYDCFCTLELTAPLGIELAAGAIEQGNLLAAQQRLLSLTASQEPQIRRAAIAHSSRILHQAKLAHLAESFDRELRGPLANQECLPGRTGLECLAESAATSKVDGHFNRRVWPYGQVELSIQESMPARRPARNHSPRTAISVKQSDDVLSGCDVTLVGVSSARDREIVIHDGLGRDFYRAKLDRGAPANMNLRGQIYGVTRGNLLILSLGREIVAFDTLSAGGQALWRTSTASNLQYPDKFDARAFGKLNQQKSFGSERGGNLMGVIGPVTASSCLFQIEQRLVCVDSLSGAIKWSRDNLPLGCDLYGDDEYAFAMPSEARQALVFSAVDGRALGETAANLPTWQERLATVGGQVIGWRKRFADDSGDWGWELFAVDSLSGDVVWEHDFEKNARLDIERSQFVAVAESTGHCVIVDLSDGSRVVDQPIKENISLQEVHLLVGSDSFLLALQEPPQVDTTRHVTGFNRADFTTPFAGQLYLFARNSGEAVWERPAEVQGLPLMLAQPRDLPIIAFAGNVRQRDNHGSKNQTGILLLEKSTGRRLFHGETMPQSANHFVLKASGPATDELAVEMLTRKIALKFTDRPRPPEPPAMRGVAGDVDSGPKGLQKIGEMIMRGGS